jgi:hypothetical protein
MEKVEAFVHFAPLGHLWCVLFPKAEHSLLLPPKQRVSIKCSRMDDCSHPWAPSLYKGSPQGQPNSFGGGVNLNKAAALDRHALIRRMEQLRIRLSSAVESLPCI